MTTDRNRFAWSSLADDNTIPVLLIRHGQTSWNKEKKFLGRTDIPLDEEGLSQARRMAMSIADIPLSGLYSSPLARAWQTAEAISSHRTLSIQPIEGLTELDQGELEGHQSSVLQNQYTDFFTRWRDDPTHTRVPGGETLAECHERASQAIHQLLQHHKPGPPVAIVSHRMAIGNLICEAMNVPLRENLNLEQRNTAINLLGYRAGKLSLHRLNDASHLD